MSKSLGSVMVEGFAMGGRSKGAAGREPRRHTASTAVVPPGTGPFSKPPAHFRAGRERPHGSPSDPIMRAESAQQEHSNADAHRVP